MEDFVHLHVHTQYSILDGQSKIPRLVDKAIKDGMRGMAVTDHGVMFGIKELVDYCGKVNKDRKKEGLEPFKPIIGCEMYVARRTKGDREKDKGDMSGYHLIVLAKNYNGYKNLIKLVSNSWVDIPARFGPHQTVYSRFCKWRDDGTLLRIFQELNADADYENLCVDSTSIKAHPQNAGAKREL